MWPGGPCVPGLGGASSVQSPQFKSYVAQQVAGPLEQAGWNLLVGVAAVGGLLLGLWIMAGAPSPPKAVPVPV